MIEGNTIKKTITQITIIIFNEQSNKMAMLCQQKQYAYAVIPAGKSLTPTD